MRNNEFITVSEARNLNNFRKNVETFNLVVPTRNKVIGYSLMPISAVAPDLGIFAILGYALTTEETFIKSLKAIPVIARIKLKRLLRRK